MEIDVKDLAPGMIFSSPVYIDGNNLLVPAGAALRKKDIDRLVSWGCGSVTTEGDLLDKGEKAEKEPVKISFVSGFEKAGEQVRTIAADSFETEEEETENSARGLGGALSLSEVHENKGAYRNYISLIDKLDVVFSHITSGVPIEPRVVDELTGRLLHTIREERNQVVGFILGGEVSGHHLAKSSVNTAILSALTATELKLSHYKVMHIVTGALFHDAGMLRLPAEITNKSGGLSRQEEQRIHAHPIYAYKILTRELMYPDEAGLAAIQHHERWDGAGYPRKISGEDIDIGARIVSVTDAFEAMVSEKPYRNSMMGYQAMKNLLSDNSHRFDPEVLKAFFRTMGGVYPIGSVVMLNSGAVARIMDVEKDAPLRPKIRVLIDESGVLHKNDEGPLVNLLAEKNLFIVRALNPREISARSG